MQTNNLCLVKYTEKQRKAWWAQDICMVEIIPRQYVSTDDAISISFYPICKAI